MTSPTGMVFDPECRRCPRLSAHLLKLRKTLPAHYHNAPVAPFGDPNPTIIIVGLAPGTHGANATGRPFTGDHAGLLLYETLHEVGLANQATATSQDDGLKLLGCRITNAVKCLPPENKPTGQEVNTCNAFLRAELAESGDSPVIVALGTIAHKAILKALELKQSDYKFAHNALFELPDGRSLLDSYHCSRYNTQTGRLTAAMFRAVLARAVEVAGGG